MAKEYKVEVLEDTLRRITKANAEQWKNIENTLRSTFSSTFSFHQIFAVDTGAGGDCLYSCVWEAFKSIAPTEVQKYNLSQGVEYLRRLATAYALDRYNFESKHYTKKELTSDNLFVRTVESDIRSILGGLVATLSRSPETRQDLYKFSKTLKVDNLSQSNLLQVGKMLAEKAATLASIIGNELALIDVLVPFIRGRMGGLENPYQDRFDIIGKFPSNNIEDNVTAEEYNGYFMTALAQNQFPSTKRLPSLFAEQWTLIALCNVLMINIVVLRFDNQLLDVHRFLPRDIERPFEKVPTMYLLNDDVNSHYYLIFMTFSQTLPELPLHTRPKEDQYSLFCKPLGDVAEAAESKRFSAEDEAAFALATSLSREAQSEEITPSLLDISGSTSVVENINQLSAAELAAFSRIFEKFSVELHAEFLGEAILEIMGIISELEDQIKAKTFDLSKISPTKPVIWDILKPIVEKLSISEIRNVLEILRLYLLSVRYPEDFNQQEMEKFFGSWASKMKMTKLKKTSRRGLGKEEFSEEDFSEPESEDESESMPRPQKGQIDFKTAKVCVSSGPKGTKGGTPQKKFIINGQATSQAGVVKFLTDRNVDATIPCRADRNIVLVPDGARPSASKTKATLETWQWSDFAAELKRQKKL